MPSLWHACQVGLARGCCFLARAAATAHACVWGAQDGAYWGAWALSHFASLALSGLLCALIALYPFPHTGFGVMLGLLWLTAAALIAFAYFLSTLFAKSRVAGMASAMLYALAMVPG